MPLSLFGHVSSPFDEIIERATSEKQTSENWQLILEVCDRLSHGDSQAASDCALSLRKRLNHRDPHVVLQTLSVIDSCINNCGLRFKEQSCGKEFIAELKSKATGSNRIVAERTRSLIKRWCVEESANGSLEAMQNLFADLKRDGYDFPSMKESKPASTFDINSFQKEEEDLAKAIQLSLKEQQGQPSMKNMNILQQDPIYQRVTVKALYEFEAAEDNELSFKPGEFISIVDDSDPNWWRGTSHRGEGLFPASFVTKDLGAPIQRSNVNKKAASSMSFGVTDAFAETKRNAVIDEEKLDKCLLMIQDIDPTDECPDSEELIRLEMECASMGQLIENELSTIDQEHNRLAEINVRLMDAINSYNVAMNESVAPVAQQQVANVYAAPIQQPQECNPVVQYQPVNSAAPESFGNNGAPLNSGVAPM